MRSQQWPQPTLQHVYRLTDDCGVIQHAKFWFPDYASGYCADDNSRALIVACHHYRLFGDTISHELMVRYLAFLFYVQRPDGHIRNFIDYSRNYMEEVGSPDSLGRTIWALGHLAATDEEYLSVPAREMFHRALVHLTPETPPHALAYGLLGISTYGEIAGAREEAQRLAHPLVHSLLERYHATRTSDWEWILPALTYGNARFPHALLRAGTLIDEPRAITTGLRILDFLNETSLLNGVLSVIGCHGWYPRGGQRALFDQQPIDAGAMVEANLAAYRLTGQQAYADIARTAMSWFYGNNIHGIPLFSEESGGCYDGLHAEGINANQGAESTLVYLLAQLAFYEDAPQLFTGNPPVDE